MTVLKYWDATQNQYVVLPGQPGQVYAQVAASPPAVSAPVVQPPMGLLWVDTATNPAAWTPPVAYYPPQAPPASGTNSFTDQSGDVWVSKNGSAWQRAKQVLHSRVARNAAGSCSTSSAAIAWDTITRDPFGMYSTGVNAWIAPVAGQYLLGAQVQWSPSGATQWINIGNNINGTSGGNVAVGTGSQAAVVTDMVEVTANTQMSIVWNGSAAFSLFGGAGFNFGWCTYLGPY